MLEGQSCPRLPPALPPHGYDVAIASREAPGAVRYHEPFYRHLMGSTVLPR